MSLELNVLALVKGREQYIFVYDDSSQNELIGAFHDQAADPTLSLTWFDALVLKAKAREQQAGADEDAAAPSSHPRC